MKPSEDHKRVSPEGKKLGENLARIIAPAIAKLAAEGESDERCKSCAFRAGTVPNGCLQTQMDVLKAVFEKVPFFCHVDKYADGSQKICHGWFAATWASKGKPTVHCDWDFSPPDDDMTKAKGSNRER